jgi:long-chain fatty acid transport protein
LILYPTIALAWAPLPWLRIGAAIQPSFADIEAVTHANASGGQSPSTDVTVDIKAKGFFLAGNIGAQILASDRFSFGAHVHLSQIPRLRGTATQTLNPYASDPRTRIPFGSRPDNAEVDFVLPPLQARIGARYAHPRGGATSQTDTREGSSYDPMRDDVFDVEVNLIYEMASANQYFHVINSKAEADFDYPRSTCPKPIAAGGAITTDACLPRLWSDVFGVRVGGDVNAIPDVLALRAGVSYETGAQSTRGANLDALGYDTFGLHAGATFRPTSWLSVHVAYAHYFMSDLDAKDGELSTVTLGGTVKPEQCAQPTHGQGACTANRGLYEASLDSFNLGATARF